MEFMGVPSFLNLFSSDVLSNKNIEQAEKEKVVADNLRNIGMIWLTTTAVLSFSYFIFLVFVDTTTDFKTLLFRWLVLLFLTLPTIYILKESSRHRADERKYRKLGVQLATIDSYLATCDQKEKTTLKNSLLPNFFGNDDVKVDYSTVPDLLKSFEKVQESILSIANKQMNQTAIDKEELTKNGAIQKEPSLSSVKNP